MDRTRLSLSTDLPLDSWCRIGEQILSVSDSSSWWIGDWLVFGQKKYRDRYRQAMKETSLDYQTLRNYAWVARKFDPARRRDKLTFQHHMEVAALSREHQEHWLEFAVQMGWTRNELRKQIKASNSPSLDCESESDREVQLNLRLDKMRVESWKAAARENNQSLMEWVSTVLDRAV